MSSGTIFCNHGSGNTGKCRRHNSLGMKLVSGGYGSRANRISNAFIYGSLHKSCLKLLVIQELLGIFHDGSHGLRSLYRVLTVSGFSGEHYSIRTVVYRIGYVGNLRSGRSWISDHGIQHLGCRNNQLSMEITFFDNLLLQMRKTASFHFYAQVSSCHHDSVCLINDGIQIIQSLLGLNLSDNLHLRSCFIQQCTNLPNGICGTYKGSGNEIKLFGNTKANILDVLLRDGRKLNRNIRYIHTLSFPKLSSVGYLTMNFLSVNGKYL